MKNNISSLQKKFEVRHCAKLILRASSQEFRRIVLKNFLRYLVLIKSLVLFKMKDKKNRHCVLVYDNSSFVNWHTK